MPIKNRFAELLPQIREWRHQIHANPELGFCENGTAAMVAELLRSFGCDEVEEGVGKTGVVGVIKGNKEGARTIGLRADMDALPIIEENGFDYASKNAGVMHACGHDGHTAMLLGAAKYLAETRNFAGKAVVIFQPAEELSHAGAKAMIDDGLLDRYGIDEVFGLHNMPGLPVGSFITRPGGFMASSATIHIKITGKGGHAARPHVCIDPMPVAAQIILACQSIVSRKANPVEALVVSLTNFTSASTAVNVIPETVEMGGTMRALDNKLLDMAAERIKAICEGAAMGAGATAEVTIRRGYPVTFNDPAMTEAAISVAQEIAGEANVDGNSEPAMAAEDFSFMLQQRPGCYMHAGNGDTAGLHSPTYNFNDDVIPYGASWLAGMAEARMKG